ncbi:hypothetical protein [Selenomonas ruminantium]|uniref:hypothetical protein n=1 Tax=Selenomonas ruminantium TaxID=971 RepID=UPI0005A52EC0|nr:hypothetical protein [Selenomonas ruminantium]
MTEYRAASPFLAAAKQGITVRSAALAISLIQFTIPGISFTRTFRIVCHVNKYLTPAMENFIDLCGE